MAQGKPRVVVAGAGFGGIRVARRLQGKADVTIVDPTDRFTFRPLVHELVSEESRSSNITRPVEDMVEAAHIADAAAELDGKTLITQSGRKIPFDHLVVAVGAEPTYFGVPGADEHALPFWTLNDGLRANMALKELLLQPPQEATYRVTVVGAGPTGLEVATEVAAFFERYDAPYEVLVVEMRHVLFPQFSKDFRDAVRDLLKKYHIRVLLRTSVQAIKPGELLVKTGDEPEKALRSDLTFWCAGIKPRTVPPVGPNVDWTCRSVDRDDVWIIGDAARFPRDGPIVPQLAQTAEQAADIVAYNILHPDAPKSYEPKIKGTILSVGPRLAVAEMGSGSVLSGKLPWHIKKQLYKWHLSR